MDKIILNDKEQLIKVVKHKKQSGAEIELHNILSFDVKQLPQAIKHKYVGEDLKAPSMRMKVPVKDGRSQAVSMDNFDTVEIYAGLKEQSDD